MQIVRYLNRKIVDIISISAILALSLFFFSIFLKDDISNYNSLKQKLSSLRSSADSSVPMINEQKKKASDIADLEKEMDDYKNALARRHRIEVSSIEPGEVTKSDAFTRSMYTTILSGGFYDVYNYLYSLEEDWKDVKIERGLMDEH